MARSDEASSMLIREGAAPADQSKFRILPPARGTGFTDCELGMLKTVPVKTYLSAAFQSHSSLVQDVFSCSTSSRTPPNADDLSHPITQRELDFLVSQWGNGKDYLRSTTTRCGSCPILSLSSTPPSSPGVSSRRLHATSRVSPPESCIDTAMPGVCLQLAVLTFHKGRGIQEVR